MAKRESMVRGVNMSRFGLLEGLIEKTPFVAQTANGTARPMGTGWNRDTPWTMPELEPDATRPAGRSNRTGE